MSEGGVDARGLRAVALTLLLALLLAGAALWRSRQRSARVDENAAAREEAALACADPVAVAWPGAGERLGCRIELPAMMALAAKRAGCRLGAPGARPVAGERLRFSVGEGGACALSLEPLSGSALLALGLPIDLNRARAVDLEALGAIGPTRAKAVIADREARGPFETVTDLGRVSGIGPKTLEAIRAKVTVVKTPAPREDASDPGHAPGGREPLETEDTQPVRGWTR